MNLTPIYNPPERPNPHPICLLMPSADEDELQNLTDDIRAHGLLDPIVLFEKRILDGRIDAIGWHPAVYFNEPGHALHGRKLGAIISVMTDMITAEPTGAISRTYIHEGRKLGKAKTLGSPAGIIRLSEDADVLEGLHIAEGLETALAGMSIGLRPMWAAGSTALMAKFPVLSGVEALTVIVDHDANAAGERAARELEARWLDAGREVRLLRSDDYGDLNDIIAGDAA
jgi:hypothetical protein